MNLTAHSPLFACRILGVLGKSAVWVRYRIQQFSSANLRAFEVSQRAGMTSRLRIISTLIWLLMFGHLGIGVSHAASSNSDVELFSDTFVPHLQIEVPEAAAEILRSYRWQGRNTEKERTNVWVTVREGSVVYTNVAMHLKGAAGSFRPYDDKPGMTLTFSKNGSAQRFHGLEKIHLNNSVQDFTYMCEILARELFNQAGVPTPRAGHAVVALDGRPPAIYVLTEGWNKQFLKRHFKDAKGNLYDGGFAQDVHENISVTSGDDPEDRSRLEALVAAAQLPNGPRRLEQLNQVLDVDRFLTLASMEILLTHLDGYCMGRNNYRVFHDRSQDRMVFLPHGMDQLFGTFHSTPEYTITPAFKSLVGKSLMAAPSIRPRYLARLRTLYTNLFQTQIVLARVDQLSRKLKPEFPQDAMRARWTAAVDRLKQRIERRIQSVGDQLSNPPPTIAFDAQDSFRLKGWTFHPDISSGSSGERRLENGKYLLTIHNGPDRVTNWASWRTKVLLEPGMYRLEALTQVDSPTGNQDPSQGSGAMTAIRISGDRSGYPKASAHSWVRLNHRFEIEVLSELELVCELRGTDAQGSFDADSLKIIREKNVPLNDLK